MQQHHSKGGPERAKAYPQNDGARKRFSNWLLHPSCCRCRRCAALDFQSRAGIGPGNFPRHRQCSWIVCWREPCELCHGRKLATGCWTKARWEGWQALPWCCSRDKFGGAEGRGGKAWQCDCNVLHLIRCRKGNLMKNWACKDWGLSPSFVHIESIQVQKEIRDCGNVRHPEFL